VSIASDAINTILEGIKLNSSNGIETVFDSSGVEREFDSNVIDESDSQSEKQYDPRISTLLGSIGCPTPSVAYTSLLEQDAHARGHSKTRPLYEY
jgi:hypothetical protein